MERATDLDDGLPHAGRGRERSGLIVVVVASLVFLANIISPPRLMDDVDAVQAQIARNMLASGDWVTARLDGVAYLEKSPLVYWMMAASFSVFGVRDWSARLPLALAVVLLCWVTYRFGRWAFGVEAGIYAGIALACCVGLFLFTRILIPDATLTLTICLALWSALRLLEPQVATDKTGGDRDSRFWSLLLGASLGAGLLLKGLIAVAFPCGALLLYLLLTRQMFSTVSWRRLRLPTVGLLALAIALPWHVLATLRNPPYFAYALHSGPGEYHGFFWFYFFNEHILRFLNLRYPRDYNTVPRLWFWLLNLVWLFPWTVYLPGTVGRSFRPETRAGRARLLALCWIAVVMLFFTFSTTQEYYSLPIYPAMALLIGDVMVHRPAGVQRATAVLCAVFAALALAAATVLVSVWHLAAPGDIASALAEHPELYTLSLGHVFDLTLRAFAYLKLPLGLAALAFTIGALGLLFCATRVSAARRTRSIALVLSATMILFFQAARLALVRFDPYLGSYQLAQALLQAPPGRLIENNAYYAFSSVFFYTDRDGLLLNGRVNNLEYGSYAPDAPHVFIDDALLRKVWEQNERCYLLTYGTGLPVLRTQLGSDRVHIVAKGGDNYLVTNTPLQ